MLIFSVSISATRSILPASKKRLDTFPRTTEEYIVFFVDWATAQLPLYKIRVNIGIHISLVVHQLT